MGESEVKPPPFPYNNSAGLAAANRGKPLAALNGDTSTILARLDGGESVQQIATDLGISHVSMYRWLLLHAPEEWSAISASRSLMRLEQAEKDMDEAKDQVSVSKARESHRMGAWTLERVASRLYGAKPDGGVTVNVVIDRSCGTAVEPVTTVDQ